MQNAKEISYASRKTRRILNTNIWSRHSEKYEFKGYNQLSPKMKCRKLSLRSWILEFCCIYER